MRPTLKRVAPVGGALGALAAVAAVAFATPPSGQHPTTPAVGTINERQQVNVDGIKFRSRDAVDVATFTVTYDAGGYSGWHRHPGVLFVVVQSGAVVREIGCRSVVYHQGDAFIESDEQPSGQVRNASVRDQAVLTVAQIVPKGSPRRVEDVPPEHC